MLKQFARLITYISLLIMAISITACGGGGGGGEEITDLQIDTTAVSFSAEENGTQPGAQDFLISWTRSDVAGVLVGYPPSITLPTWLDIAVTGSASPLTLTLSVNTTALPVGTHTTMVRIVDGNANGELIDQVDIPVTYTISGSATPSPTNLTFEMNENGVVPGSQTVVLNREGATVTPSTVSVPVSDDWVQAAISGNDIIFTLTANAAALNAGYYQTTTTINYAGNTTGISLPVSLFIHREQVNFVAPHPAFASVSGEAIIRGHGFLDLTNPEVLFGATVATSVSVISDTEIRANYPGLAVGNYGVTVRDTITTLPSIAELVVIDPPAYTTTSIPRTGYAAYLLYDAVRQVIYVSDSSVERELERHQFNGVSWDSVTTPLGTYGLHISLSNNGDKLIKLNQNDFSVIDPDNFSVTQTISLNGFAPGSVPRTLAFANNGLAIINSSPSFDIGTTLSSYDFLNSGFKVLGDSEDYINGELNASLDGSRVYLHPNFPPAPVYFYEAVNEQITTTPTSTTGAEYGVRVDRTGSKLISVDRINDEVVVYDGNLTPLGVLPPLSGIDLFTRSATFEISPDGTRAYAYVGSTQMLHVLDLTTPDGSNGFVEIGTATLITDGPVNYPNMLISPDGGTLFIAGSDRLIVQPTP